MGAVSSCLSRRRPRTASAAATPGHHQAINNTEESKKLYRKLMLSLKASRDKDIMAKYLQVTEAPGQMVEETSEIFPYAEMDL